MLELSVVSHAPGVFDGFIETGIPSSVLPQGGRDTGPATGSEPYKDGGAIDVTGRISLGKSAWGWPSGRAEFPGE